jgi:hypothetical protein
MVKFHTMYIICVLSEKLISTGVVSGALLLSRHGQVLFKYGELKHTLKVSIWCSIKVIATRRKKIDHHGFFN